MSRREIPVSPPFDQGVFLVHLNKGREAYRAGDFEGARLELEFGLKYRPEDEELLNLLGLVYFKLRMFPEAEAIYLRLTAKNPDIFILRSNLGLILFKTGRVEEALPHFKRAVELSPNFIKAHLYLAMIYRKKKLYAQALEHFKFAEAPHYVREMEELLAKACGDAPATVLVKPAKKTLAPAPGGVPEITSKIPIPVRKSTESTQPIPAPKREPEGHPFHGMVETIHQEAAEVPEKIDLSIRREAEGSDRSFFLHPNGFLEVRSSRRVFIKKSSLRSYTGNFRFAALDALQATPAQQLHEAAGEGHLFLYEKNHQTYLFELNQEFVYVEGSHILAMEENLAFRREPIHDYRTQRVLESFKVYGRGILALLTHVEPLTLRVTPNYPLTILSDALVAWTGHLYSAVVDDGAVREGAGGFTMRFEGEGIIIADEVV